MPVFKLTYSALTDLLIYKNLVILLLFVVLDEEKERGEPLRLLAPLLEHLLQILTECTFWSWRLYFFTFFKMYFFVFLCWHRCWSTSYKYLSQNVHSGGAEEALLFFTFLKMFFCFIFCVFLAPLLEHLLQILTECTVACSIEEALPPLFSTDYRLLLQTTRS